MLVTIATYTRQYEASLAQARLASEGIRAFVHGENTARVFQGFGGELGTILLQVSSDDEANARAILAMDEEGYDDFLTALQAEAAGEEHEEETFTKGDKCPRCGSDNLFTNEYSAVAKFGSILLLGIPFLFMKHEHECTMCGMKFTA